MRSAPVGAMKGRPRGHAAQRDELQGLRLASKFDDGFIPIDLRLAAPGVGLRHADLAPGKPEFELALADILADGVFGNLRTGAFLAQPTEDAMDGMALFARGH